MVASVTLSVLLGLLVAKPHNSFDLRVYRGAVESWAFHGDLYGFGMGQRHSGFTYPPFAALCMLPMVLLPLGTVTVINVLVMVASAASVVRAYSARLSCFAGWGGWFAVGVLLPPLLLLQPLRDTLTFGQINLELGALVVADMLLLERGSRWAGVGAGLATAMKLTPGLFIVFYLVSGRWRAAGTSLLTFGAVTLGAALVAPSTSWQFWTSTILDTNRVGSYDSATNQSVAGLLARLANSSDVPAVWVPIVALVVVGVLLSARRHFMTGDLPAAFVVVGLGACAVSPISWVHHLWWIAPALLVLVDRAIRAKSWIVAGMVVMVTLAFASGAPDIARVKAGHHHDSLGTLVGENLYGVFVLVMLLVLAGVRRRVGRELVMTAVPKALGHRSGQQLPAGGSGCLTRVDSDSKPSGALHKDPRGQLSAKQGGSAQP